MHDIERHVAIATYAGERRHRFTRVSIKYDEQCRFAGGDKKSVVTLIKRHWVGCVCVRQGPAGNQMASLQVNNPHLVCTREIYVQSFAPRSTAIASLELP